MMYFEVLVLLAVAPAAVSRAKRCGGAAAKQVRRHDMLAGLLVSSRRAAWKMNE
jgi:hypothetical protein